jgi:hypothetical protein
MANTGDLILAAAASLLGGIGLKLADWTLSRGSRKDAADKETRHEQDTHITNLEKRVDEKQREVDYWREKYYDVLEERMDQFVALVMAGKIPREDLAKYLEAPPNDDKRT